MGCEVTAVDVRELVEQHRLAALLAPVVRFFGKDDGRSQHAARHGHRGRVAPDHVDGGAQFETFGHAAERQQPLRSG